MNHESSLTHGPRPILPDMLRQEFRHLRASWWWFLLLGILLAVGGTAALVFPAVTVFTSYVTVVVLGVTLMISGTAVIVTAFWAGRWSGLLVHLLVGILYFVAGLARADAPRESAEFLTLFLATLFIVAGAFRAVAALVIRFPHWGWTLLNGVITLLCGVVIYRHFHEASLWVIGVLVGVDLLFQGWSWIALSIAVRNIPEEIA
jgi:uncharacterized membrane protein HdeD (DUF308 family)